MPTMQAAIQDFLAQKNIAVVGVSSTRDDAANLIYRKLRSEGHAVFAVNPKATTLEGDPAYPSLESIPARVDGAVIVTRPEVTEAIVAQCAELGIKRVWMHKGMGSSVSDQAVAFGRERGITVIAGGCPMMYCRTADFGHRCIRWWMETTGGIPRQV